MRLTRREAKQGFTVYACLKPGFDGLCL